MKNSFMSWIVVGAMALGSLPGCTEGRKDGWAGMSHAGTSDKVRAPKAVPASETPAEEHAEGDGHDHSAEFQYSSLAEAMLGETKCMNIVEVPAKLACLDGVADFWFHNGGHYVESNPYLHMIRIMQAQVSIDPSLFEKMSSIAFYQFSDDVNDLVDGVRTDFSTRALDTLIAGEAAQAIGQAPNSEQFEFYNNAVDLPILIITHRQFGSEGMKKKYYAQMKHLFGRMQATWTLVDRSQYTREDIAKIEASFPRYARFLARNIRFDVQPPAGSTEPTPAVTPAPEL
jgi:hypothetical protein